MWIPLGSSQESVRILLVFWSLIWNHLMTLLELFKKVCPFSFFLLFFFSFPVLWKCWPIRIYSNPPRLWASEDKAISMATTGDPAEKSCMQTLSIIAVYWWLRIWKLAAWARLQAGPILPGSASIIREKRKKKKKTFPSPGGKRHASCSHGLGQPCRI